MTKLEQAITAIRSGDKTTGRQLLMEILEIDKDDEQTWLWLTQALSNRQEQITGLERKFNPNTFQISPPNSSKGREKSEISLVGESGRLAKEHRHKPHSTTDSRPTPPRSKRHKFFMVGVPVASILLALTFYLVFNRLSPLPQSSIRVVNALSTKLVTVTPSFASSISNMAIDVNISSPKISTPVENTVENTPPAS